ncbi:hypothetical protein, conserved [Plasmodium gonderi]|uniref:Uncharacterized protein n=1 Tax=Plasmodium gonderi TaxID=77519 RepID=A0A1Y1JPL8_PLAGO|nr:hypothetical protein, conserved [Plasmodium gonderi]GAW83415.1 hypothetical protein, conserved [Plasmodium gonderi]
MNTANSNEEKNLLIYDKSSKVGCIYFIGISSNIYQGKVILKKNCISDRIVRYTNLNENLMLIKNGNFNFKQTAILIKGITIFLHRQLEVLLTDFYTMYKKCLFSSLNTNNSLNGIVKKKYRENKRYRAKKNILPLQDGTHRNTTNNNIFGNKISNYFNKNKNIAHMNDLMLKESNDLYVNDYNFGNDDIQNEENIIYQDMLTNTSSFEYSKFNNLYTINNQMQNLNTKETAGDIIMQSNINSTALLKFNLLDMKTHKNLESNNNSNPNLFVSKHISKKNFSISILNSSLLINGGLPHEKTNNNLGITSLGNGNMIHKDNHNYNEKYQDHNKNNEKRNEEKKNKRGYAQIDNEIILKDNIWNMANMNKKKKSDNHFNTYLEGGNYIFFFLNNDMKNNPSGSSMSSSFHSYERTKNYINFDARKDIYNIFGNELIQNEKNNMEPNNFKLLQTKSTTSSLNEKKNKSMNHLNFEQLRENFNDDYFMKIEVENNPSKKRYSKDSFVSSFDQMEYDFDRISDMPHKNYEHKKLHQNGSCIDNKIRKGRNYVYTLSDTLKDSLSVPSSKLVNKRSCTSSEYKYNQELIKLKNYLHKIREKCTNVIEFDCIFPVNKMSDKNISLIFYNLLVLASNAEIEVIQNSPDNKILIQVC